MNVNCKCDVDVFVVVVVVCMLCDHVSCEHCMLGHIVRFKEEYRTAQFCFWVFNLISTRNNSKF